MISPLIAKLTLLFLRTYLRIFSISFLLLSGLQLFGISSIELRDTDQVYRLGGDAIEIYEDKTGKLEVGTISSPGFNHKFHCRKAVGFIVNNPTSAFWVRIKIADLSTAEYSWLLEMYDNRIDDITAYIPSKKGGFKKYHCGDLHSFRLKEFDHINYIFPLNALPTTPAFVYLRLKSDHEIFVYGLIHTVQHYVHYASSEYFLVAIFYGVLLAMLIYDLLMYLSVRDRAYLYYIFYVASILLYSLSRDGFGYQFVWRNLPEVNILIEPLSLYAMMITILLFSREFLHTKDNNPLIDQLIWAIIILRTLLLIFGVTFSLQIIRSQFLDMVPMLFLFVIGFISYSKGYVVARYYVVGFTALFVGYTIVSLEALGVKIDHAVNFYAFNIGVVVQLVVLSISLADRIRLIIQEKNLVQSSLINELREKEKMKSRINAQLEEMVKSRTSELEKKNNQLDSFVYKASHDIKGPLRSLMGLAKVGMKDLEKTPAAIIYFEHMLKTATKLDEILADLLAITKMKSTELRKNKIFFEPMINEIFGSFKHLQGSDRLKVDLQINQQVDFYSDDKLLYSILQNFIENAIKYQDFNKPVSHFKIKIDVEEEQTTFYFEDNGSGIEEDHVDKIFDMFYKVNEGSVGSGLGLYIVKQSIEKLGGSIEVQSKKMEYTKFQVVIPAVLQPA